MGLLLKSSGLLLKTHGFALEKLGLWPWGTWLAWRLGIFNIGGWGVFQPGNLNGSCVRDLVAGDIFENSPPSLGSLVPLVMHGAHEC